MPFLGNIGPTELIFLLVFLLLIFGARRLPELGSGLGKGIREFKRSMRDINTEIERAGEERELESGSRPAVTSRAEAKNETK
jgi:sec-independent protein translocase protein TatA